MALEQNVLKHPIFCVSGRFESLNAKTIRFIVGDNVKVDDIETVVAAVHFRSEKEIDDVEGAG